MKRIFTLFLATAVTFTTSVTASITASAAATYPVASVSRTGYLLEEDSTRVDLTSSADMVPYGDSIYFPLLNGKTGSSLSTADQNNLNSVNSLQPAYSREKAKLNADALTAAIAGNTSYYSGTPSDKVTAAKAALAEFDTHSEAKETKDVYNGNYESFKGKTKAEVEAAKSSYAADYNKFLAIEATVKHDALRGTFTREQVNAALASAYFKTNDGSDITGGATADTDVYNNTSDSSDTLNGKTRLFLNTYLEALGCVDNYNRYIDAENVLATFDTYSTTEIVDATLVYNNNLYSDFVGMTKAQIEQFINDNDNNSVDATKKTQYDAAIAFLASNYYKDWSNLVNTLNSTYKQNYNLDTPLATITTYINSLASSSNGFKYVYESAAAGNMRVSASWESGKSYVDSVSVEKLRVSNDSASLISGGSGNYIYFLVIKTEKSSSTTTRDVYGTVTLKQTSSSSYDAVTSFNTSIAFEVGYNSDVEEGVITRDSKTFKEGSGFDADDEFEFTFEADSRSRFVVNTSGQGSIVLSFNTDYINSISNKYPNANLSFFNGNYASFNRTGTLYLYFNKSGAYVYSVDSSGNLSSVSASYDTYDNCYYFNTRTLGRYVISDVRLSTTSTSSSSSSSSSVSSSISVPTVSSSTGTGTGTGTGTTTTSSYAPVPSSSVAPPPSSSSSIPSSSSEPEEESEEEETPEESEMLPVISEEEEEEPEEVPTKEGIAGWVWALIITGLAAIPVAVGVIYYINNKKAKKDFFEDDDDFYDDED